MNRGYRDRDYIITHDRLIFTVVGNLHPRDRVISYLKYTPSNVKWHTYSHKGFTRALKHYTTSDLLRTLEFLEDHYPQYVFQDDVIGGKFSNIPKKYILKHLKPEKCLEKLHSLKRDRLEEKAVDLALRITDASSIDFHDLGVTGSILVKLHNERYSDLDLTVYGRRQSMRVKNLLKDLMLKDDDFKRFSEAEIKRFYNIIREYTPLTMREYLKIYKRLWNRGRFKDTYFSIHPVKREEEVTERYGDEIYSRIGPIKLRGSIEKNDEAVFLPAKYDLRDAEVLEGKNIEVCVIICFDGLYSGVAEIGDLLEVKGTLELVSNQISRKKSYRVVVGSLAARGSDYLKLI